MPISRRDIVPEPGRKTEYSELYEAFSDEELVQGIKRSGISYFFECY